MSHFLSHTHFLGNSVFGDRNIPLFSDMISLTTYWEFWVDFLTLILLFSADTLNLAKQRLFVGECTSDKTDVLSTIK
jgi:hypothetical protein